MPGQMGNREKLRVSYEPTNQCDPGNCILVTVTELSSVRREERTEDNCADRALHVGGLLELPASGKAIEPTSLTRLQFGAGRPDLASRGLLG